MKVTKRTIVASYLPPKKPNSEDMKYASERISEILRNTGRTASDITDDELVQSFRNMSDDYDDWFGRGLRTPEAESEFVSTLRYSIMSADQIGKIESGLSFDFVYEFNYNSKAIEREVHRVFEENGMEVIGIDFESVDYSSFPDYADENVSQCSVSFLHDGDYYDGAIIDELCLSLGDLECWIIGYEFYTPGE